MSIPHENDQAHARKALDEAFERQNRPAEGLPHIGKNANFCSNPAEYEWKYTGKREILVPYNCDEASVDNEYDPQLHCPKPGSVRWEIRLVWIVEGALHKGESNVLILRRFYIDAESWLILLGEGYDHTGELVNFYMLHKWAAADKSHEGRWYLGCDFEPKSA